MGTTTRAQNARLATEYLAWQRDRRNRSRETVFIYTDVLSKLLDHVGDTPLGAVSIRTLEGFVDRPRVRRRPHHTHGQRLMGSPATRKRDVTILRSFYRYLTERGHVGTNPALLLTAPTVNNVQPKAIDDDTWRAVWTHPQLAPCERVVLGLGFFCGLRRNEIIDLRASHVDLDRLRLVDFPRKGGMHDVFPLGSAVAVIGQRLPHLLPDGADAFLAPLTTLTQERQEHPYLIPWGDALGSDADYHVSHGRKDRYPQGWCPPYMVNKRLRRILRRCGLLHDAFSPHALRHSFVTNLLRADVPLHVVSRLAAHADVRTTLRYVKTGVDPLADFLDGANALPRPGRWQ